MAENDNPLPSGEDSAAWRTPMAAGLKSLRFLNKCEEHFVTTAFSPGHRKALLRGDLEVRAEPRCAVISVVSTDGKWVVRVMSGEYKAEKTFAEKPSDKEIKAMRKEWADQAFAMKG